MADNDIKQKIQLSGEKEYNNALKEAKRNLKTLRSELKAETAELGANATAQQKNETRMKSLQKQIKEQEKIVKTYQEALKEVKEKYSDNEEAIAKWEVKLNDARTSLANMRNELEGVGKGFDSIQSSAEMATVASKSVADSFGRLADIGEVVSDGIKSAFTGLISTAKQAISTIWGDITDVAARSNNLVDLAGFWNTDVLTIQKYAGAVKEVSGDLEDLNSLVTKINAGDAKKITELTKVSPESYKDQWKYAMAVMDALSEMSTDERNKASFEIFGGKQATKAFDLLNDWESLLDHLDKYDVESGGFGLGEIDLLRMSELYDKVNGLEESWNRLKAMTQVNLFGDLAINITSNAQNIVDALLEYMNASSDEERDSALEKITENITEMFVTAADAIQAGIESLDKVAGELKTSKNPVAQALGSVLNGLVEALQWLTEDHMSNVVKALEIFAAFWLGGKGLTLANKLLEVAQSITTIKTFSLLKSGGDIASAAAASGAAAGQSWGAAFASAVLKAAPWLVGLGIISHVSDTAKNDLDQLWDESGNPTQAAKDAGITWTFEEDQKMAEALKDGGEAVDEAAGDLQEAADTLKDGADTLAKVIDLTTKPYQPKDMEDANWMPSYQRGIQPQQTEEDVSLDRIYTDQDMENAIQDWWDAWRESAEDETSNFDWMQEVFGDQFGTVWDRIIQRLDELGEKQMELEDIPSEWWKTQGGNSGETDGLTSSDAKSMTAAVTQMPKAVAQSVSGLRVYLDGATVGRMVAPYVSQSIAYSIGG